MDIFNISKEKNEYLIQITESVQLLKLTIDHRIKLLCYSQVLLMILRPIVLLGLVITSLLLVFPYIGSLTNPNIHAKPFTGMINENKDTYFLFITFIALAVGTVFLRLISLYIETFLIVAAIMIVDKQQVNYSKIHGLVLHKFKEVILFHCIIDFIYMLLAIIFLVVVCLNPSLLKDKNMIGLLFFTFFISFLLVSYISYAAHAIAIPLVVVGNFTIFDALKTGITIAQNNKFYYIVLSNILHYYWLHTIIHPLYFQLLNAHLLRDLCGLKPKTY